MKRVRTVCLVLALGGVSACEKTAEEAQEDAVEAQREANQEIREVQKEANEEKSEAQREAQEALTERDREVAEAEKEAREKTAEAQTEANEEIRAANTDRQDAVGQTEIYIWARKQVDEVSNEIDEATVKAQKAPPQQRTRFEIEIRDVREDRDELSAELRSIEERAGNDPERFRSTVKERVMRLKDRIDDLERKL